MDTGPLIDGPGNSFTTYLNNASGQAITVRESDGIHITFAGADLVTPTLLADVDPLLAPAALSPRKADLLRGQLRGRSLGEQPGQEARD